MRKVDRCFGLVVVVSSLLAACGSDGAKQGDNYPGAEGGELPTAPEAAVAACTERFAEEASCAPTTGTTYYVSSSSGSDDNPGTSADAPLASVAAVNALTLAAGDRVLFACGEQWRGEDLTITASGAKCAHIVYSTYPEDQPCDEPPTLLGSQPVTGFVEEEPNIWVADLTAGDNAARFPNGLGQVFSGDARLPIGRWPNPDDPAFPGGWAHMDDGGSFIADSDLPDTDFTGAVARIKTIRWLLLSREVTGSATGRLTLNEAVDCWDGCGDPDGEGEGYGWGYHLVSHRATLDQPGEWYFDDAANRLYVVASAEPTALEASPIPADVENPSEPRYRAGINLGPDMGDPISYVVVEGLRVKNHFNMGIASPVNFKGADNHHLTIRCNTVTNPEQIGINLQTWIFDCSDCTDDWYGGTDLVIAENVIEGANKHGIMTRSDDSVFQANRVQDTGLLRNLGKQGLWCGFEGSNCTENGDAVLIMSASRSSFTENVITNAGHGGFDIFGDTLLFENNVIDQACATKGDCGAIRSFGGDNLDDSFVHDVTIRGNLITNVLGVTDGDSSSFSELFGFGLYIDNNSRDVLAENNVVVDASVVGILYQNSSGSVTGNLVVSHQGRSTVSLSGTTKLSSFTGNQMVALAPSMVAIAGEDASMVGSSDNNVFFTPYTESPVALPSAVSLSAWQSESGMDQSSTSAWYTLSESDPPNVEVFVNPTGETTTVTLEGSYSDLDQASVSGSVELPPYGGVALVKQ